MPARVAFGAASAAAYALACYAERTSAVAAAFGGAAGTVVFLLAQGPGLGAVVASFAAAVPIGLVGRLMERRNLAPPLVVSIAGIVPLLPGLALLHGIYAILNDQHAVGFASVLGAMAIGTALAAGVTLGEWSSFQVRKRRLQVRRLNRRARAGIRRSPEAFVDAAHAVEQELALRLAHVLLPHYVDDCEPWEVARRCVATIVYRQGVAGGGRFRWPSPVNRPTAETSNSWVYVGGEEQLVGYRATATDGRTDPSRAAARRDRPWRCPRLAAHVVVMPGRCRYHWFAGAGMPPGDRTSIALCLLARVRVAGPPDVVTLRPGKGRPIAAAATPCGGCPA